MIRAIKGDRLFSELGRNSRLVILLTVFVSGLILVAMTGGFTSPLKMLLPVPVLLGAVLFGVPGYVPVLVAICTFNLYLFFTTPGLTLSLPFVLIQNGALAITAITVAAVTDGFRRHLREARHRADRETRRADRVEWLADTVMMMQSITVPEQSLSVALIRLEELIPFDSAAIFLRDGDSADLKLLQAMGLPTNRIGVRTLSGRYSTRLESQENGVLAWTGDFRSGAFPYSEIDTGMPCGMVISLRTLDTEIGLLYLGTRRRTGFSTGEQDNFALFAQHILFPIQRARLQAMATTDLLTGLANRRAFRLHLQAETERVRRYEHPLSLLLIDIDHFKRINDTYGHPTGDLILSQMGRVLHSVSRGSDFSARYGGEELAIICPETSGTEAERFAERIRRTIADTEFRSTSGECLHLTVSIGTATAPTDASVPEGLLEAADRALYRAKRDGRNRVRSAKDLAAAV
ncbi:MAG: sensor domain-containing diguanylate cyclase [Bacteroidia bacterium]|nr:sensor domain-containing diguanylate cyclase [Bacteroidia bacterium]